MSDGPHRSLPLRKAWKEVAKRGDQRIYATEQIEEAATVALASDFRNEVSWSLIDSLKGVFNGRDNSLGLTEIALQQLNDIRGLAAGSVFGTNAISCSATLIHEGRFGLDAFHEAIGLAAKMRGFANARSVEEHYLRESNQRRADHVSSRLYGAICNLSESHLGSLLTDSGSPAVRPLRKMKSLDEGVPL